MASLPHIFLALANNADQEFLPELIEERDGIRLALLDLELRQRAICTDWYGFKNETLFQVINKAGSELQIFHFGGHAESSFGGKGKNEPVIVLSDRNKAGDNLVTNYLATCDLKLIFLNGCSTFGFIKLLRNAGIGAAIVVTKRAIGDKAAAQFAKKFYSSLAEGNSLGKAFGLAKGEFEDDSDQGLRGIRLNELRESKCPWTLYVDGDTKEDWVFFPNKNKNVDFDPAIEDLRKKISEHEEALKKAEKKQEERRKLEKEIKLHFELLEAAQSLQIKVHFEDKINKNQNDLKDLGSQNEIGISIKKEKGEIQKLLNQILKNHQFHYKERIKKKLPEKLMEINFFDQTKAFREKNEVNITSSIELPINVFIVFGTKFCGHEILLERYKKRIELLEKHNFICLEQDPKHNTERAVNRAKDFWVRIYEELFNSNEREYESNMPKKVMERLISNSQGGVRSVLVFRSGKALFGDLMKEIKSFWEQWYQVASELSKLKPDFKFDSKFRPYFFVLDKSLGKISKDSPQLQGIYQKQMSDIGFEHPSIHLLPPISPVDKRTVDELIESLDLSKTPDFDEQEYDLPILCTIDTICSKLSEDEIFKELFRELKPHIPSEELTCIREKNLNCRKL